MPTSIPYCGWRNHDSFKTTTGEAIDIPLQDFVEEANEILDLLEAFFLSLEESGQINMEEVTEMKRQLHTLKGAASLYGFEKIEKMSHKMEDLVMGSPEKFIGMVDTLLACVDLIREMANGGLQQNASQTALFEELISRFE